MAPTVVLDDVSAGRQRREKGVLVVSRQGLNQRHGFRAHLTVLTQKKKQSVEKESSAERAATAVPERNLNFYVSRRRLYDSLPVSGPSRYLRKVHGVV